MPNNAITSIAELDAKLVEFESLPDDWDSYGAKAISPAVTARAREIWEQLRPASAFVCPGGDGFIELSLKSGQRYLSIIVAVAGTEFAYYTSASPDPEEEGELDIPRLKQLIAEMGLATT